MPITARLTLGTLMAAAVIAPSALAQNNEFCVVCSTPDAIYRCQPKVSEKFRRLLPNTQVLRLACVKDITHAYGHGSCSVREGGTDAVCPGVAVGLDLNALARQYVKQLPAPVRTRVEGAVTQQDAVETPAARRRHPIRTHRRRPSSKWPSAPRSRPGNKSKAPARRFRMPARPCRTPANTLATRSRNRCRIPGAA